MFAKKISFQTYFVGFCQLSESMFRELFSFYFGKILRQKFLNALELFEN